MDDWRDWFDFITVGDWARDGIEWLISTFSGLLSFIREVLFETFSVLTNSLQMPPWWLVALAGGLLAWLLAHTLRGASRLNWRIAVATILGLLVVDTIFWYVHRATEFALVTEYDGPYALLDHLRPSFLSMLMPSAWAMILLLAALAALARSLLFGGLSLLGLLLIAVMGQWTNAMQTLAMVLVACLVATILALPVGILAARSRAVSLVVKPVLDFMQTMPALIYVLIAVFMFQVGVVPGIVATIVFSMPPAIRLTELGIRQVEKEVVEAGHAFGSPPRNILRQIQLPLALPTIMAGINQMIMLALSMVVLTGFVGAPGLGQQVLSAISRVNLSLGVEAGLSVVILAIYLDRVTAAIGERSTVAQLDRAT